MDTNAAMIPFYNERVKEIEKEILAIANNAPYADLSDNKAAYLLTLLNKFYKIRTLIIGHAASRTIVCEGKDFALNFLYLLLKKLLCLIK